MKKEIRVECCFYGRLKSIQWLYVKKNKIKTISIHKVIRRNILNHITNKLNQLYIGSTEQEYVNNQNGKRKNT